MIDWTHIERQWSELDSEVRAGWLKLTDDDLTYIAGSKQRLIGKVQERYGVLEQEADRQVHRWFTKLYLARDKAASGRPRAVAEMPAPRPFTKRP